MDAVHLLKVVQTLAKLGYVETLRGRGGGIRLATPPQQIQLGRIIRQVEPDFAVVECMDPARRNSCVIASACRLQTLLDLAVTAFLQVMDQYTLADLLKRRSQLRTLLHFDAVRGQPQLGSGRPSGQLARGN
jgi:Rrf2 family nitric oxide-sensitive transcriptional repressor